MTRDDTEAAVRHWDDRYRSTSPVDVSWFEATPQTSLELIDAVAPPSPRSVVDVGGGAGRLVDHLVARGDRVAVVDISAVAIDAARERMSAAGADVDAVEWIVADVRAWVPRRRWDVWHDRALLHFLTGPGDVDAYLDVMHSALVPGGAFVIGEFAEDGPTHCSGLAVHRYSGTEMHTLLADAEIVEERRTVHVTPSGAGQSFRWLAGRLGRAR